MDVAHEITEVVGGYEPGFPVDLCRICRSPEEPGNPLRYPCACRGSIKYVHQECIHLWLNRRGYKHCEICGHNYSFIPVYSENAPERLPCLEFLKGVLVRASPYMRMILHWVLAFLLNTYCLSLHPSGKIVAFEHQRVSGMSWKSACLLNGFFYNVFIFYSMVLLTLAGIPIEELINNGGIHSENLIENYLGNGFVSRVAHVLWRYKKIICDWGRSQLESVLGSPPRLDGVAIEEFDSIRWLVSVLDANAFTALAISIYVSFLFVLLPFSIGWIVLATFGDSYFSDIPLVTLGDLVMMSICFAYFGIFSILRQNTFSAIFRWFSLGLHFIKVKLACLLCVFSTAKCKNRFVMVKGAFVLGLKIGVLPWIIGCWLDICTFSLSGTTMSKRIEILSNFPFLLIIHWMIGRSCLKIILSPLNLIHEIIRKRAFWYLLDVRDPDHKITNLNLGKTLFVFASYGILFVIFLHLPIKAITLISPSFFPLQFWSYEEGRLLFTIQGYMMIMVSASNWSGSIIIPAILPIVRKCIITVSSWLLVPQGEVFQNGRPLLQQVRQLDHDSQAENGIEEERDSSRLVLKLAMLLILTVLALFLVSTTIMALPILLGRAFFYSLSFITRFRLKHDDFLAFWIGCYILRAIYIRFCVVFDHIWRGRADLLLKYVLIWILNGLIFSIWISVIPGLLGLLIDLMIIIPSRVAVDESPIYFLINDWLIGVAVLHIWTFLTMLTPINCFATKAWRRKFKRISNVGINKLPSMWLLRDVIGSIINTLLTALCIPYLLVKALFPLFGYSQRVNSDVERYIWPVLLAVIMVWFIGKQTYDFISYLHQLILDDRYVVGERVDDLTEDL